MHKKLLIAVFAFILIAFPVYSLVTMPKGERVFSENENRFLAPFPKFSIDKIGDRSFMKGFDTWASDRFLFRDKWINLKNNTELLLGKTEIKGIFISDNMLIQKWDSYSKENVEKSLLAINDFANRHIDIPVYFMLVPTSQEIYPEKLPPAVEVANQRNFIKTSYEKLPSVNCIDVTQTLMEHKDMYIFYRTDHHWTSLGAYLAYVASSSKLNITPIDIGNFNIEHAGNNFLGTLYSKILYSGIQTDIVDFYLLSSGEPELSVEVIGGAESIFYDSLYFREYLDKKDKYASFLGENNPMIKIKTNINGNNKKLLIFKDSFANCLIPFYAKNYSEITVMDMRYINSDYRNFLNVEDYDQVLFLYNVITFSEDGNLVKLNMGKK